MAMLFQYLSGKLGIAGYSLAEVVKIKWKNKFLVFLYWLLARNISIIATDLAEFLGIVVALNLLFGIPLFDWDFFSDLRCTFIIIFNKENISYAQYAFILFVSVIGVGYIYELYHTTRYNPDWFKLNNSQTNRGNNNLCSWDNRSDRYASRVICPFVVT